MSSLIVSSYKLIELCDSQYVQVHLQIIQWLYWGPESEVLFQFPQFYFEARCFLLWVDWFQLLLSFWAVLTVQLGHQRLQPGFHIFALDFQAYCSLSFDQVTTIIRKVCRNTCLCKFLCFAWDCVLNALYSSEATPATQSFASCSKFPKL